MTTTITIPEGVWQYLHRQKRPGDSFDDVLQRELFEREPQREPQPDRSPYETVEFPSGVNRADAIAAIDAAAELIEREREATMREIVGEVSREHPLKYGVQEVEDGERYRGSWWRKVVKPGLEAHPAVEKPSGGQRAWRWVG
jgi:hypothetical protein